MTSASKSDDYYWFYRDLLSRNINNDDNHGIEDTHLESYDHSTQVPACVKKTTTLSIFDCKCAIIQLYGKSIPTKEIASTLQNSCSWVPDGTGVTYEQFYTLLNELSRQNIIIKSSSSCASSYYNYLDKKGKGWITADDFRGALSTVAPSLARKYADDIFALADIHQVGQVTKRSYVTSSHHRRINSSKSYDDDDDDDDDEY